MSQEPQPPLDARSGPLDDLVEDGDDAASLGGPAGTATQEQLERLALRIRALPSHEPAAGWEDRARARWRAARKPRRWRTLGAVAVGFAAVAVLALVAWPSRGPRAGLTVSVEQGTTGTYRGSAALHDRVHAVTARSRGNVELRIYRDATLIARCPGAPTCRETQKTVDITLPIDEAGLYRVFSLSSHDAIPAPGDGLDSDLLEARQAGVKLEAWPPIPVGR